MKKVTSLGGIFFKCNDPQQMKAWYAYHLGLNTDEYGTTFEWRHSDDNHKKGFTVWSPFEADSGYFAPSIREFMINYRVEDIEAMVESLKNDGVTILDEIEEYEYGKFVHILDPEGNKIELWEPNDEHCEKITSNITK
jgi:predicted enzyme related to lactoylglutathione lyase